MALTLAQLQDYIDSNIKKNGKNAITGDVMNYALLKALEWVDAYAISTGGSPGSIVTFDKATPTTGGVVFDPNTPATVDQLYVSDVNASTWIWNGTSYITYTPLVINNTEWNLAGTAIDAGGNKTASIERIGSIKVRDARINSATANTIAHFNSIKDLKSLPLAIYPSLAELAFLKGVTSGIQTQLNALASTSGGGSASGVFGISNSLGVYTYYSTLTLAMAAATSGQVIEMFADVVETGAVSVTLKNGVNINGNGHTYTLSNSGTSNALRDNAIAVSCEIYNMKIIRTLGTTASNIHNMCLSITSTTSEIKCNGAFFKNTNGTAIRTDGSIWGASAIATNGSLGTIFSTGNVYDGYFESTNVNAIYANSGNIINCKGIANTSGVGIYVQNATGNVYNSYGKSSSGTGLDSGGGKMFNSIGVSITGYGIGAASGVELTQCTGISTSGFGLNGNSYFAYQCRFISSSSYGAGGGTGAEHFDCSHESTSNVAVFGYVGLKLYRGVAYSKWNNAGGHAFQQWSSGSGSVLNNVFLRVTNASAACIDSGGVAATISYSHNSYLGATTPISSFITQTLINTEDNQGNIKL